MYPVRTIITVTFPSEPAAYEGLRALEQLHADGTITLYDTVVVERRASGELATKQYRHDARPRRRTGTFGDVLDAHVPPGTFAVIAEVFENQAAPIDARIADVGGTIVRRARPAADDARAILQRASDDIREALDQTKLELHDKVKAIQDQLVNVRPELRPDIEQRIVEIRRELGQRERKLSRALQAVTRAIMPRPPVARARSRWRSGAGRRAARASTSR
jgi:hypothetical protein